MASNGTKCARCDKMIYAADKYENYERKVYHSGCFKCSHVDCGIRLNIRNVKGFNQKPYCNGHVPKELLRGPKLIDNKSSADEAIQQNPQDIQRDLMNNKLEDITTEPPRKSSIRKEMRKILHVSGVNMVDKIFSDLSRDMHIVVCGSPRVGKSTLINAICGREVAKAGAGLASVTQTINCYSMEGDATAESGTIHYKYNFWDTPGFESWKKENIQSKVKEIIEKPESKPLCMIFCASPGTFVDLTQLEWLLDLCINKRHIFCALICTNKYAGEEKSSRSVLETFNTLLSKYVDEPPRIQNDITFYGNIGLSAAVNSQPYQFFNTTLPRSGINELIYGIMESLVDEEVLKWCLVVLENKGFWGGLQQKVTGLFDRFKGPIEIVKNLIFGEKNPEVTVDKAKNSTK